MGNRPSFSPWLLTGMPSAVAVAILGFMALHAAFRIPWEQAIIPMAVLLGIYTALYIGMFWIRQQFLRTQIYGLASWRSVRLS